MSYSLMAHSPYEGYKLTINGSKGRLEAESYLRHSFDTYQGPVSNNLRFYNRKGEEIIIKVPVLLGSHGGADSILPLDGVREIALMAERRYRELGRQENFKYIIFERGHSFPEEVRTEAYKWIDKFLQYKG